MPDQRASHTTTPEMKALGQMLRELRQEAELTQQQIADRINVDRPMISNWELGKGNITWNMLHRLVNAYGKRLHYRAESRSKK